MKSSTREQREVYLTLNLPYHVPQGSLLISEDFLRERRQMLGDFPGGAVVKNLPANAGDTGSFPGPGRSHMPRSN